MQVPVIMSATVKENIGGLHIGCKTLYRQLLDEDIDWFVVEFLNSSCPNSGQFRCGST